MVIIPEPEVEDYVYNLQDTSSRGCCIWTNRIFWKWNGVNQTIDKPNNRSLFQELFANTKVPKIFRNLKNHICK